jgi:NADP-dependent 3-hydroxy acid dehydrogenase YdfG
MSKHCLVVGVGPGLGLGCVRRFADSGYKVTMIARHAGRLASWTNEIDAATGYACDVADIDSYKDTLKRIVEAQGEPDVVVYNAAKAVGGHFDEVAVEDFEFSFRINTTALLVTAQMLAPAMVARGQGALMVTGNTGSLRGSPNYIGWSPAKAAQRILSESLARDLGPKGVHIAYIVVDAVIDMPFARRRRPNVGEQEFAKPYELAETVYTTAHQPRSAWSFYVELRPFCETW